MDFGKSSLASKLMKTDSFFSFIYVRIRIALGSSLST